jgi:two-component system OmpR family sensor kinase
MKQEAEQIHHRLVRLQRRFEPTLPLYLSSGYQLLLLDIDKNRLARTASFPTPVDLQHTYQVLNGKIIHIRPVDPYYLGTAYILLSQAVDEGAVRRLQYYIFLFMLGAGVFFLGLGYFLGRLFIAPMRESMERMNRFIQDTTHELNTPVSTILTNLELIEALHDCDAKEEMKRIEIASKTLSRIYDDLTYLKLNQNLHRNIRPVNFSTLLKERLIYFSAALEAKQIEVEYSIDPDITVTIDREDAVRLLDNLISNGIKYNRMQGKLSILLNQRLLTLKDSGIGIAKADLAVIHERFRRANQSEGGFGIGLNIVYHIVKRYRFGITIDSIQNQGTEVTVIWEN